MYFKSWNIKLIGLNVSELQCCSLGLAWNISSRSQCSNPSMHGKQGAAIASLVAFLSSASAQLTSLSKLWSLPKNKGRSRLNSLLFLCNGPFPHKSAYLISAWREKMKASSCTPCAQLSSSTHPGSYCIWLLQGMKSLHFSLSESGFIASRRLPVSCRYTHCLNSLWLTELVKMAISVTSLWY